jgi:hypothetical protein
LTVLVVSILITGTAHRNLCDFINHTIFSFLIRVSNSSFVFILHVSSLSYVRPHIFLRNLLSKTSRRFCSVTVMVHVSRGIHQGKNHKSLYILDTCLYFNASCMRLNQEFFVRQDGWFLF